jgi:hypothetical protein
MEYPLVGLIDWTRRQGGDMPTVQTSTGASDGTPRYTINDEGTITITKVEVAYTILPTNQWVFDSDTNILTFTVTPDEGDEIVVPYSVTRYSDTDILAFLINATYGVGGDLNFDWDVDLTNPAAPQVIDNQNVLVGRTLQRFKQLIVYRAGADLNAAKANEAADDAIKIRDDDTSIDTSVTAAANQRAIARLADLYARTVIIARSEGFIGTAKSTGFEGERRHWGAFGSGPGGGWMQCMDDGGGGDGDYGF